MEEKILVIDDEMHIVELLKFNLEVNGYIVDYSLDSFEGYHKAKELKPNLILLDWMLPNISGIDVLKKIREDEDLKDIPVIMLTAKNMERDKVKGLEEGADDYITKPFGTSELLARIRAAIRHFRGTSKNQGEKQKVTFLNGKLVIDYDKHRVYVEEQDAGLTQNEFRLLSLLGKYAGKVLTYDYMMKEIWGPNMKGDNRILRVNMANIRRKIEKNPGQPQFIFTEVGVGYRIIETDS